MFSDVKKMIYSYIDAIFTFLGAIPFLLAQEFFSSCKRKIIVEIKEKKSKQNINLLWEEKNATTPGKHFVGIRN